MKAYQVILLILCAFTISASIDWGREGKPVLSVQRFEFTPHKTVEFGLRSDGVVVWREITHGQTTTNSPADPLEWWSRTMTNWIWLTNAVTNIYLEAK